MSTTFHQSSSMHRGPVPNYPGLSVSNTKKSSLLVCVTASQHIPDTSIVLHSLLDCLPFSYWAHRQAKVKTSTNSAKIISMISLVLTASEDAPPRNTAGWYNRHLLYFCISPFYSLREYRRFFVKLSVNLLSKILEVIKFLVDLRFWITSFGKRWHSRSTWCCEQPHSLRLDRIF